MDRGVLSRQTFETSVHAIWGPGEEEFTYLLKEPVEPGLYVKQVGSGPGRGERLAAGADWMPTSWSSDGQYLAALRFSGKEETDIWILQRDGTAEPFVDSEFYEVQPEFSPNGRWLAYVSWESDHEEVYVRAFPGPGPALQISVGGGPSDGVLPGGRSPSWSRDGSQIIFRQGKSFYVVDVREEASTLAATRPRELFQGNYSLASVSPRVYDITPSGSFLLSPVPSQEVRNATTEFVMPNRIQLVENWFVELEERAPR